MKISEVYMSQIRSDYVYMIYERSSDMEMSFVSTVIFSSK